MPRCQPSWSGGWVTQAAGARPAASARVARMRRQRCAHPDRVGPPGQVRANGFFPGGSCLLCRGPRPTNGVWCGAPSGGSRRRRRQPPPPPLPVGHRIRRAGFPPAAGPRFPSGRAGSAARRGTEPGHWPTPRCQKPAQPVRRPVAVAAARPDDGEDGAPTTPRPPPRKQWRRRPRPRRGGGLWSRGNLRLRLW
jgi:hypothetical protein